MGISNRYTSAGLAMALSARFNGSFAAVVNPKQKHRNFVGIF